MTEMLAHLHTVPVRPARRADVANMDVAARRFLRRESHRLPSEGDTLPQLARRLLARVEAGELSPLDAVGSLLQREQSRVERTGELPRCRYNWTRVTRRALDHPRAIGLADGQVYAVRGEMARR